jgi:hypothetical protein
MSACGCGGVGVEVGARLFQGPLSWRKLPLASSGTCAW